MVAVGAVEADLLEADTRQTAEHPGRDRTALRVDHACARGRNETLAKGGNLAALHEHIRTGLRCGAGDARMHRGVTDQQRFVGLRCRCAEGREGGEGGDDGRG